ncbi:NAD(P)H-binding domain-containing protein [Hirsutella rhossiliensis]|uniref:NAD(P)H-binding domain-containing protein n=1 Tax=Hirsutella rhossiliensis TaxID=111463 RepID=A0A9P8SGN6_9HYPO|nr:NAD(P)H-binding domain-containing protein [Hirsutella rhossiliensis]KAH0961981.1 NAD(P)H-binding domain-containing protein [Hirsutella rhossiliensis]
MKVIVTGATGNAGRQIVQQCIDSPRITKVVILTRRAVSGEVESHPKVEVVMQQDFSHYTEAVMSRLEGAEACLWAIGSRAEQLKSEKGLHRKVGVELPITAAKAFCARLANKVPAKGKFRFVFCSRHAAERSRRPLLLMSESRRCVNEVERGLGEVADDAHRDKFEAYILRPASFIASEGQFPEPPASVSKKLVGGLHGSSSSSSTIGTVQVGKAMVHVACNGWRERTIENDVLVKVA